MLGYLCGIIGLILACLPSGSTDVTASASRYTTKPSRIPILSHVLFMRVGDPYIYSLFLRIFDLLVLPPFLVSGITYRPFVYRDGTGWPASLPYIRKIHVSVAIGTQSGIRLHKRVPMVKIWGSSKNDQNRVTGKLLKL